MDKLKTTITIHWISDEEDGTAATHIISHINYNDIVIWIIPECNAWWWWSSMVIAGGGR